MNDSNRRKFDKVGREDVMVADNPEDYPPDSRVALLTDEIAVEKARFLEYDAMQTSGYDDQRQAQEIYDNRRDDIVDLLEEYVLAAAVVDDDIEGTAEKFRMPRPRTDGNIVAKATSFYNDSADIDSKMEKAGLRVGGREQLNTFKTAFQAAAGKHDSSEEKHAEATGGMNDSMRKMMSLSRRRDKSVKLKYRNNAAKLGAWTVASHLDRAPKRNSEAKKKPDTPVNP